MMPLMTINARQLHRAIMTVGGLLLAYWVLSGLTLAVIDATDRQQVWAMLGGGPGARIVDVADRGAPVPPPNSLAAGIGKALASARDMAIAAVDYRMSGPNPRLELSEASGERDTERRFYAETGAPMTPLVADGNPFRPPPAYAAGRERIKSFHKGDAFGLPGQILGLLTGCALLAMAVTGLIVYLRLWFARRRVGKPGLFWNSRESAWRRWHRGIAIVAAAFVLNKAITGTILAWGEIQVQAAARFHVLPFPYPMPTPLPPQSDARLQGDLLSALETSYAAAHTAEPDADIVAIELVRRDGRDKGLVTFGGGRPHIIAVDPRTGTRIEDWATGGLQRGNGYFADWHQVLKRMHRGDIVGRFGGRYLDITVGLCLAYLVCSGFIMYLQTYKRRGPRSMRP